MRLLSVSLLEGLPVFGEPVRVGSPLVRYEYNSSGNLVRIIGRDGNVKRSFGYKNNLMVSHTDAAGLVSEYEYDHYTPTGKVLRNWTSLGEEWRFTYHDGYTEVTDVLGRIDGARWFGPSAQPYRCDGARYPLSVQQRGAG